MQVIKKLKNENGVAKCVKKNAIATVVLTAFFTVFGWNVFGVDYHQSENFGAKSPGDTVGFIANPPGTVISGSVTNPGGFLWIGRMAAWNGTIPDDFRSSHVGKFDGTYIVDGTEPGRALVWQVDTKAEVVKVGKIEITAEGRQHDVTGQEITLLKGTKYTFKAIPDPSNISFPSGEPKWSGIGSGSGETIRVTFDTEGVFSLNAKCGSETGKKVDLVVIVPEVEEVRYKGQDIVDRLDKWTKSGINDPACFVQNRNSTVEVIFKHGRTLTYNTDVVIYGDVSWWDDDMTGGNYSETATNFKNWPSTPLVIQSESTTEPEVDYYEDVDITWQYKVPSGTNSMIDAGDTNGLKYYLVWNDQVAGSDFIFDTIKWSCDAAEDTAGEDNIREEINDGIYEQYVYHTYGNCYQLASNFVWSSRVLGIGADAVRWSVPWSSGAIGDMVAMEPVPFTGAGGTNIPGDAPPPNPAAPVPLDRYCWGYHQWAQSGGKQYDPSAGKILNGAKGAYEDISLKDYAFRQNATTCAWVGANHPGQSIGCESTASFSAPLPVRWERP